MGIKERALRAARSRAGGWLAYLAVHFFPWLLPVRIRKMDRNAVRMEHPHPMKAGHEIIVPRKRIRDLVSALRDDGTWEDICRFLSGSVDFDRECLVCSLGTRQEVKQLHFHVLPDQGKHVPDGVWTAEGTLTLSADSLVCRDSLMRRISEANKAGRRDMTVRWVRARESSGSTQIQKHEDNSRRKDTDAVLV